MKQYVIRQKCGGWTCYLTTFNEFTADRFYAIRMNKTVAQKALSRLHKGRTSYTYDIVRIVPRRKP